MAQIPLKLAWTLASTFEDVLQLIRLFRRLSGKKISVVKVKIDINAKSESEGSALGNYTNRFFDRCQIPVDAFKQFTIHSAPLVLTIHLKRFTGAGKKIGRLIDYPQTLKLGKYVSDDEVCR